MSAGPDTLAAARRDAPGGLAAPFVPPAPAGTTRSAIAPPPLHYRPEIDGLRAIAVIVVILYHARLHLFGVDPARGGFVGVDIFFVISGYLIGLIVLREIRASTFTFRAFYERRARRILPAIYTVLALTIPFSWRIILPRGFQDYSASIVSSVGSVANIFFWWTGSYDAEESLVKPNIHIWSLGIEEQFYLLVPVLLLLSWKYARRALPALLWGLCLCSLLLAEWMTHRAPDAAFFLLPSRMWELGAGLLLAQRELWQGRTPSPRLTTLLPALGLILIFAAIPFLRLHVHHPGLFTLIPVLGVALVIWFSGHGDPVTRMLSSPPFVGIGLISYSLYLWHQPIFALGRLSTADTVTAGQKLGWIALALVLATATYWLVEKPTRSRRRTSARTIWLIAGTGAIALAGFGLYGYRHDGLPGRFAGPLAAIAQADTIDEATLFQNGKGCLNYAPARGPCRFAGADPHGYALLTIGDSHARTLSGPLVDGLASYRGIASFTPLNRGGCVFILGLERYDVDTPNCPGRYNNLRMAYLLGQPRPIAILLSRLPLLIEQRRFDNREGGVEPGDDHPRLVATGSPQATPAPLPTIRADLARTVRLLLDHKVKVVLVYPLPEMGWNVPRKLLQLAHSGHYGDLRQIMRDERVSTSRALFQQRTRRTYALLDAVGSDPNLIRVYPERIFCPGERCLGTDAETIFYRDDNHLSRAGAARLDAAITAAIAARWGE